MIRLDQVIERRCFNNAPCIVAQQGQVPEDHLPGFTLFGHLCEFLWALQCTLWHSCTVQRDQPEGLPPRNMANQGWERSGATHKYIQFIQIKYTPLPFLSKTDTLIWHVHCEKVHSGYRIKDLLGCFTPLKNLSQLQLGILFPICIYIYIYTWKPYVFEHFFCPLYVFFRIRPCPAVNPLLTGQ